MRPTSQKSGTGGRAEELSKRFAAVSGLTPWSEDRARDWWATQLPEGREAAPAKRTGLETATLLHAPTGLSANEL